MALSFSPSGIGYSMPLMMMVAISVVSSGQLFVASWMPTVASGRLHLTEDWQLVTGNDRAGGGAVRDGLLQRRGLRGGGLVLPDVVLQLAPELRDCVLDRPGGAVGQAADRRPRYDAQVVGHVQH